MQSKQKKRYESREFAEIMSSLTPVEQGYLREKLKSTLAISRTTLWHWETGRHTPNRATRLTIVNILDKCLGIKTTTETLFR